MNQRNTRKAAKLRSKSKRAKGKKKSREPHVPTERSVKQDEKIGKKTLVNGIGNT